MLALRLVSAGALLGIAGLCPAQQNEYLYGTPIAPNWRDNYTGGSGCMFTVGSSNVVVSHLGYFSTNTANGLLNNHPAGIYDSNVNLLGQVTIPAGNGSYYYNRFYWVQLDPPLLLLSNTLYYVAVMPYSGDGDWWGDSFAAGYNPYFVGSTATSTRQTAYGPGGSTWPIPSFTTFGNNTTYCLEGLGFLPQGPAKVGVQNTNVSPAALGQTVTVTGFATGQTPIAYQWWRAPNTPLSGQTNAILTLTNVTAASAGTYFLTVTNALGGEQSPNVTVAVSPVILGQTPQTANPLRLFVGATPAFSLTSVAGISPLSYQWFANGAALSGATSASYTSSGLQAGGPTQFYCVVTNVAGSTTSLVWTVSVLAAPTAPYPAAVLADKPIGYWRLNETPDNDAGNDGTLANDYWGGNDGIYTNAILDQAGYNSTTDPTETSAEFGYYPSYPSQYNYITNIQGINFATTTNGAFSIEAWAKGDAVQHYNAGIVAKGAWAAEQFTLDTGGTTYAYRFTTRDSGNTLRTATSNTNLPDGNWHHLVGVLDEVHSNLCMYVDGALVATTACSPSNGVLSTTVPVSIGARTGSGTTAYSQQFFGTINDVAIYNYALSANQVATHYQAATAVMLSVQWSGSQLQLTWPQGALLQAPNVTGPWTTNSAPSPYTVTPSGSRMFYRVQVN